jgi:hypothetical protein
MTLLESVGDGFVDESRRALLRKAAAGAGMVWAAPALQSFASPAVAGTPAPTTTTETTTPPFLCSPTSTCNPFPQVFHCGSSPSAPPACFCVPVVEGGSTCSDLSMMATCNGDEECVSGKCRFEGVCICSTSADCAPGQVCVPDTCYGSICLQAAPLNCPDKSLSRRPHDVRSPYSRA